MVHHGEHKELILEGPRMSPDISHSNNWRYDIIQEEECLKVIPVRSNTLAKYFSFKSGCLITLLLVSPAFFTKDLSLRVGILFMALLLGGGGMLAKKIIDDSDEEELAMGTILTINSGTNEVLLHRSDTVIPIEKIVRLEITDVSSRDYIMIELQIITTDSAWPVIGTQGEHEKKLRKIAERVAMKIKKDLL